ncbi:MAG: protein translocase subunit SecF, partial [Porticoccaceae bacterium]
DVLIRLQGEPDQTLAERVYSVLQSNGDKIELRRVDFVGPQIGEELREDGGLGMLAALAVVMLYVAVRFQFKFALGAVLALVHDVIITMGFFSIFALEFDLTVLAAVLAVVGYSLNDTIIVFDRIRENFRKIRKAEPVDVINESMSQTLWRTINTSFTTMLVLLALFFLGGELIHNFSVALIVGIGVGTYSSIYVASTLLLALNIQREDILEPVEGELVDDLP